MELPSLSFNSWHTVLVALAVELGCFGPALLALSYWTKRRWTERLLALVPVAAFGWMLLIARNLQAQSSYWKGYLTFAAYYYQSPEELPQALQVQRDYSKALEAANHLGWITVIVTEAVVLFSGALILRWRIPQKLSTIHRAPPPPLAQNDEIEITFEPLDIPSSR